MEILIVLGLPLLGTALLALFGARRFAPELNAGMSLATLDRRVLACLACHSIRPHAGRT